MNSSCVVDRFAARHSLVDLAVMVVHKSHPCEAQRRKTFKGGTVRRGTFGSDLPTSFSTEKNGGLLRRIGNKGQFALAIEKLNCYLAIRGLQFRALRALLSMSKRA